jgi:acyl carrier protein phosphodiesterase
MPACPAFRILGVMNYLAHAFLSAHDPELQAGNFIADHVRGNDLSAYPERIAQGIRHHRLIDSFCDADASMRACKRFFYEGFERYSGILVDFYTDHLLAAQFRRFSQKSLADFSTLAYGNYLAHIDHIPMAGKGFLNYVLKNRVYESYAAEEGILRVLEHFSHRIGHGIQLQDSFPLFKRHLPEFQALFDVFFPVAIEQFADSSFNS